MSRLQTTAWLFAFWVCLAAPDRAAAFSCSYCLRPITGSYLVFEGRNLHEVCYYTHFAKRCAICRGEISGQYLFNSWGDTVCAVHLGEYPTCEYCDRLVAHPLTGRGARYDDGRHVCGHCEEAAVSHTADVRLLLDSVRQMLATWGITVDREPELLPIDKHRMLDVNSELGREAWAYTDFKQTVSLFGLWKSERIRIYVLSRMPRVILRSVLAHELMHVWLFTNAPLDMDPSLCEGSCEYAARLVVSDLDDPYVDFLKESQDTSEDLVYGAGFRSVRDYVRRQGVPAWLAYLRTNSSPPWLRATRTGDR